MPEGDTIHRAAGALRRAMLGDSITQFSSTVPEIRGVDLSGRRISEVQARGKNLLIDFDDGRTLLTHMRMTGSWHIYRPDERWRKPARQARIVIHTPRFVFVCFNAPVVKLLRENERERELSFLGPDVLADELDIDRAIAGLRSERDLPVGEALLSQRLLAGIGNIYKSETLFSCGVHPLDRVGTLTDRDLERLVLAARRLMRANVASDRRKTRVAPDGQRYWVYRRRAQPCFRCGEPIAMIRQGPAMRSTYYCARCQRAKDRPASDGAGQSTSGA